MAEHVMESEKGSGELQHQPSTVSENIVMKREGLSRKLLACSLLSYMAAFNFGWNNAIIGSTLGQTNFYIYFADEIDPTTSRGATLIATIVGMVSLGGAFGVLFNSWVNDKFGRRWGFVQTSLFVLLSVGLSAGAKNITMLCFGRFFAGFGAWASVNVAIVYVQELAPSGYRGEFGVGIGPALNAAYLVAGWVQVGFFYVDLAINWRIPLMFGAVWSCLVILGVFFVPESPRWLIWKGRHEEALRVFETLHADPRDPEHLLAREEHYQVTQQVALDKTLPQSWVSMLTKYRRRTAAASLVTFTNSISAIQVVTNYGPTIYAAAGLTGGIPLIVQGAWLAWANLSAIFWAMQIDRIGRKKLFIFGSGGMCLLLSIITALYQTYVTNAASASNLVAGQRALIFMFFPYVFIFEMTEPTEFLYIGEIFPMHIRAKGVAMGLFSLNIAAFWVTICFPNGVQTGGGLFFILFVGLLAICTVVQQFVLKESRGVPLEEMAAIWGSPEEVAIFSSQIKRSMLDPVHDTHAPKV